MSLMKYGSLVLLALLSAPHAMASTATSTASPPTCDLRDSPDRPPECPGTQKRTHHKSCPVGRGEYSCVDIPVLPTPELECDSFNNVVSCEAWPQSPAWTDYQYFFTPLGGVSGFSATGPTMVGNCYGKAGRVKVTVVDSYGQSATATMFFACLQDQ